MIDETFNKQNIKVLIVEDEVVAATDVAEMLRSFGYTAIGPAITGNEAIAIAGKDSPDIILMDIRLRGPIDGIAAATEIKTKYKIPIIYLTAHSDVETIERVKKTEPYGYVLKPFGERDIYLTLELAVNKIISEKKLQMREKWFSTILGGIGDGVIVTDNDSHITYMNTAAEIMTGCSFNEAKCTELKNVFNIVKSDISHKKRNDLAFDSDSSIDKKLHEGSILNSRDGTRRIVEYNATLLGNIDENTPGGVLVFRDISERQDAHNAIQKTLTKLRKAMAGTIEAMALTVETRDPYTAGHQRRVTDLARAIAETMQIPRDRIDGIRMAGVIHDLGKISVPAEILSKPGKLSEIEFNLIKIHPQVGYDILKNIEFPCPVADIIYQHHERIDGTGYPNRLHKEEILIEARIIAVADVVEAMASHRPYRASLGIENALKEVIEKRGIFYDPDVVDACQEIIIEKGFSF